jgi:hypothetical protein
MAPYFMFSPNLGIIRFLGFYLEIN